MDGKWSLPILSTACPADDKAAMDKFIEIFPEYKKITDYQFFVDQVRGLTTQLIHKHSYNPATWTSRAYNLLRLGYPDLATGDAFKAITLLDMWTSSDAKLAPAIDKEIRREAKNGVPLYFSGINSVGDQSSRIKAYSEYLKDRAVMTLAQALFVANCFVECYEILKDLSDRPFGRDKFKELKELAERAQMIEDSSRLQEDEFVRSNDSASQETQRSGSIIPRIYPWSGPFLQRSDATLSIAATEVAIASNYKCSLHHSSITDETVNTNLVEKEANTLGIKADVEFNKGAFLLVDHTFLSGVDDTQNRCNCCRGCFIDRDYSAFEARCCDTLFCCERCIELAHNYHSEVCGRIQNLDRLPQLHLDHDGVSADSKASNSLLFRLLAYVEQKPEIHPLRTPNVSAMIPAYRATSPLRFSLLDDVKRPLMMLLLLDIDIFQDHALDIWVIQTMQARLRNNARDYYDELGNYHVAVNLKYMFFNHSCDPNVEIIPHRSGSSAIRAVAFKPIKQGEELFITYLDRDQLSLPYAERQELLRDWTGGQCQCHRCR